MTLTVVPFEEDHLTAAAGLLAARHARDRAREASLPGAFESPDAVRPSVEQLLRQQGAAGVLARRDGEPAGFLLAGPMLPAPRHFLAQFFPPRSMVIPYHGHALAPGEDPSLYRNLYAALAEVFVRRGFFDHFVNVPALDSSAREAWDSLGFARDATCAVRDVEQPVTGAGPVDVHQAGPEDIAVVSAMAEALGQHHVGSPIFSPYLREANEASRDAALERLQEPANAHFVAYRDGRPMGMNTFMPPAFLSLLLAPEASVYLLEGFVYSQFRGGGVGRALLARSMAWAREQGYRWCALHFAAPNISGASFWLGSGFRPAEYRLRRHIDERIAWANE